MGFFSDFFTSLTPSSATSSAVLVSVNPRTRNSSMARSNNSVRSYFFTPLIGAPEGSLDTKVNGWLPYGK